MTRPIATVRVLPDLPPGMFHDSDPRVIAGEVVIPKPDRTAYACKASPKCPVCWGAAVVGRLIYEPGKKPVRVEQPCSCCWTAITRREDAERDAKVGIQSGGVTLKSQQPIASAVDRARQRVQRIHSEVTLAEELLRTAERQREAKLAPYRARVTEAERSGEDAVAHARECQKELDESRRILEEDEAILENAKQHFAAALNRYETASNLVDDAQRRLAPLAHAIEDAREEARKADNRGGERHRAQVAARRLAEMQERLQGAQEDAAKLEPTPMQQQEAQG